MDEKTDAALAEWERKQAACERGDPLWGLVAYRLSRLALDRARDDLRAAPARAPKQARDQLLSAVASVSSNIAEGYSRPTGPDRARFFAYSLGSVREAIVWYSSLSDALGETTVLDRIELLSRLRKITLGMLKATHRSSGRLFTP